MAPLKTKISKEESIVFVSIKTRFRVEWKVTHIVGYIKASNAWLEE